MQKTCTFFIEIKTTFFTILLSSNNVDFLNFKHLLIAENWSKCLKRFFTDLTYDFMESPPRDLTFLSIVLIKKGIRLGQSSFKL